MLKHNEQYTMDAGPATASQEKIRVSICICTYKRPRQLESLLDGIATQQLGAALTSHITVIVADNEGSAQARLICERFRASRGMDLIYQHEPQRGISYARNTCFAHVPADCDFVIMVDDDEVPTPRWLEQLLVVQRATGADVVQGLVVGVLPPGAPAWLHRGKFFGWPYYRHLEPLPAWDDRSEISSAATNNVLINWRRLQRLGLTFEEQLALSGGEDVVFFRQLRAADFSFHYAAHAVVTEAVTPARARFAYLCRTEYRDGCLKVAFKKFQEKERYSLFQAFKHRLRITAKGVSELLTGFWFLLSRAIMHGFSTYYLALGALRIVHGVGLIVGAFGVRYQHYRRSS